MKYQVFSDNDWLYPDSEFTGEGNAAELYAARNSDVCFQILTDKTVADGTPIAFSLSGVEAEVELLQLCPAHVEKNSGPHIMVAENYEDVKDFVTRKAPFDAYDITKPIENGKLSAGRLALFVRVNVANDAVPGVNRGKLTISVGDEAFDVPMSLKIYRVQIPSLAETEFHMVNWIYYDKLAQQHNVALWSQEYEAVLTAYIKNQLDLRSDYLMLPEGEPIKDESGKVVGFDFSHAESVAALAFSLGANAVMGAFAATWIKGDDEELYLLWDKTVSVTSTEGYRQLKLYFEAELRMMEKNGWTDRDRFLQCLVDEPNFPNSPAYRALSAICRKCIPGVKINDPVESTEIAGALDIWVVKQAVYEKYIDTYRALQEMGETMWIYTCGFPAGKTMNRIIDLPLTASRLLMWMCCKYNAPGFLHFGYHLHNPGVEKDTNYVPRAGRCYPAGDSFIVYPGKTGPWDSLRSHSQRTGAYDYELLSMLKKQDPEKAAAVIESVCRTFDDYTASATEFEEARKTLLELLA